MITPTWYQASKMSKEALDFKQGLLFAALTSLVLLPFDIAVVKWANKWRVPQETVREVLSGPQSKEIWDQARRLIETRESDAQADAVVSRAENIAQEMASEPNQPEAPAALPSMDDIVNSIIRHEGLLPHQTPARITNPTMRAWRNYQGFPVWQNPPENVRPANRHNFIFLQDRGDVPRAIRRQLENYVNNPNRFGLPNNPTLEDAIRMFDHENPEAKMRLMRSEMPNIDFNRPMADYIQ